MKTETYRCDRCHEDIPPGGRSTLGWTAGPNRHKEPLDLCAACLEDLAEWLGAVPDKATGGDPGGTSPLPSC